MAAVRIASTISYGPQGASKQLPSGVRHVGELMPLVLAGYGVSLEGDGNDGVISLAPWPSKRADAPAALAMVSPR